MFMTMRTYIPRVTEWDKTRICDGKQMMVRKIGGKSHKHQGHTVYIARHTGHHSLHEKLHHLSVLVMSHSQKHWTISSHSAKHRTTCQQGRPPQLPPIKYLAHIRKLLSKINPRKAASYDGIPGQVQGWLLDSWKFYLLGYLQADQHIHSQADLPVCLKVTP